MRRLERLLALSEKTAEDLRARGEAITGEICLALRGGGGNTAVLTRAMAAFRRCHPQVRFSLPDCDAAALRTGLERGLIDLALWSGPVDESRYEALPLPKRERWGVVVERVSPWAAEAAVPAAALSGLTLLLPRAEEAAQALEDWAAAASVRLDPVLRYGQAAWAAALVRAGAGAALCPDGEDWGGGAALCAPGAATGAGDGADLAEGPAARPRLRNLFTVVAPVALPRRQRLSLSPRLPEEAGGLRVLGGICLVEMYMQSVYLRVFWKHMQGLA